MVVRRLYLLIITAGLRCAPSWLEAQEVSPQDSSVIRGSSAFRDSSIRPFLLPSVDGHIRKKALLGTLIGGVTGAVVGFSVPCRSTNDRPMCEISGAANGLGAGLVVGSAAGAWAGGGRSRCGAARGLARAAAGALIGSAPYTVYRVAQHNGRVPSGVPMFFLSVTLPFFQAEGATRAVSNCEG